MASLIRSGILVTAGILAGRLAGLLRDILLARLFGLSPEADVAMLALTLPDMLVGILLAGGFSVALVPRFRRLQDAEQRLLFWQASLLVLLAAVLVSVILVAAINPFLNLLAPGLAVDQRSLATVAVSVAVWALPLAALSGITTALLQSKERFFLPACGTLIFNLILVLMLALDPGGGINSLLYGVLLAAALRWLSQLAGVWRELRRFVVKGAFQIDGDLLHHFANGILATAALALIPAIVRASASLDAPGAIAAVSYSLKLLELPVGALLGVLPTVFYPRLIKLLAEQDSRPEGRALSQELIGLVWILAFCVLLPAVYFMPALVELIFYRGAVAASDVDRLSGLTQIAFFALPFQGLLLSITAVFNAHQDTRLPVLINGFMLVCLIVILPFAVSSSGESGVMMALVLSYVCATTAGAWLLWRRHRIGLLAAIGDMQTISAMIFALLVMAGMGAAARNMGLSSAAELTGWALLSGAMLLLVAMICRPEVRGRFHTQFLRNR